MTPGEEIDSQLDALETKIELLMGHLGLEFEFFDAWSDTPTGIREAKKEREMTKHQWIEQAKKEARQNLSGEDLKKCFAALEAWGRNTMQEAHE